MKKELGYIYEEWVDKAPPADWEIVDIQNRIADNLHTHKLYIARKKI